MTALRNERYGFLNRCSLESDALPDGPIFRITPAGAWKAQVQSFSGGRDVRYVSVSALDVPNAVAERRAAIAYGPRVSGTDLIYDVTGEFLQGKARPFECDLTQHSRRVYAVLPFQLDRIAISAPRRVAVGKMLRVQVEFQQATGDRIEGVLPFHLKLLRPDGEAAHQSWRSTERDGRFDDSVLIAADAPRGKWLLVVRSQLSGQEADVAVVI